MPVSFGIFHVEGLPGKRNWIYYKPVPEPHGGTIIFFPGDISDFFNPNKMANQPPASNPDLNESFKGCSYYPYSLDGLAWLLSMRFKDQPIIIIRPCIMNFQFACYLNFLPCDESGTPRSLQLVYQMYGEIDKRDKKSQNKSNFNQKPHHFAALHLRKLLDNLSKAASFEREINFDKIILVGFSKGCIVLTSLLQDQKQFQSLFLNTVDSIHYVDPGLSQSHLLFELPQDSPLLYSSPTDSNTTRKLESDIAAPSFTISLHSTPRQLFDPLRPYIPQEIKAFHNKLSNSGMICHRFLYYNKEKASLDMHFEILKDFTIEIDDKFSDSHSLHLLYETFDQAPLPQNFFQLWHQLK